MCQFAQLSNFDVVDGVAVDYMHGILLGVCKQLLKLWLDSKFSSEDWYCGSLIGLIDERLLSIKPPNSITRVPRSLEHHRKYWKGICLTVFFSIIMRYACGTVLLRTFAQETSTIQIFFILWLQSDNELPMSEREKNWGVTDFAFEINHIKNYPNFDKSAL